MSVTESARDCLSVSWCVCSTQCLPGPALVKEVCVCVLYIRFSYVSIYSARVRVHVVFQSALFTSVICFCVCVNVFVHSSKAGVELAHAKTRDFQS